jgi:hypothetical protein
MHHAHLTLNAAKGVRRELFEGRMHTVIPAVIAVAGVLNGNLLTAQELGKFPEAWNGRPVPILHPSVDGVYVSANWPDILERAAGRVFNTKMVGNALTAEFWMDEQRMDAMGHSAMLSGMAEGTMQVEVSTGYFSDDVPLVGEFNGKAHSVAHLNLRPDHVALLPGQVGACSIADGCGAPRINSRADNVKKALATALETIGVALGLKTNCQCEDETMKPAEIAALAQKLIANKVDLSGLNLNFDVAALEAMAEPARTVVANTLQVIDKASTAAAAAPAAVAPVNNNAAAATLVTMTRADLDAAVARGVSTALASQLPEATARATVMARLTANSECAFSETELQTMSVASLQKYEQSIRPADYSGQGGALIAMAAGDTPLMPSSGVLSAVKQ